jgi:signal transduction histidine kinase
MSIAQRLMIIVLLTVVEVSITIWAAFQISKGATFHQLNSLHLKYNTQFLDELVLLEQGNTPNIESLKSTIYLVRQQPIDCLKQVGWIDKKVMRFIETEYALGLCEKDIADADRALAAVDEFTSGNLSKAELISSLRLTSDEFVENSSAFEAPVTKTVEFILKTMIPMIIIISLFNISFITYLSRTIAGSIKQTINMLSNETGSESLSTQVQAKVSGELKELLEIAQVRIERDFMNIETNEKLQNLVNDKTVSLRNANEELEHFAYRTSHDLKAPLTRSKHMCQFILEDMNNGKLEQASKNLTLVQNQMASLETLVEDLMSLAKADLIESPVEEINIRDITEQIIEQQNLFFEDNQVQYHSSIEEPGTIFSERARLVQILGNLFSNSCKYADASKDTSWLKFTFTKVDNIYYMSIEDNGLGFPEKYRDDMYKQFTRFHPTISSGSGLGLSIVKKHIDNLGGNIEYQPKPNGTQFNITLPIPNQH